MNATYQLVSIQKYIYAFVLRPDSGNGKQQGKMFNLDPFENYAWLTSLQYITDLAMISFINTGHDLSFANLDIGIRWGLDT